MKCKKEQVHTSTDIQSDSVMGYIIKRHLLSDQDCFVTCHRDTTAQIMDGRHKTNFPKEFESMKPYFYFQHCLNKVTQVYNAASAAYTFLVRNPDYDDILTTLGVYRYEHKIPDYAIFDMEERPYMSHRREGELAYLYRKWTDVVKHTEAALEEFYHEEESCRTKCELGYSTSTSSGLTQIIEEGISSVLRCQLDCQDTLSQLYDQNYTDYLTDHYLYLVAAYVKIDDYSKAMEAASTYLAFRPDDKGVVKLRKDYMGKVETTDTEFTVRTDATQYISTRKHIAYLLEEVSRDTHGKTKYFKTDDQRDHQSAKPESSSTDNSDPLAKLDNLYLFNTSRILNHLFNGLRYNVTLSGEDLHHDKRVIMDGLATAEECEDVMRISKNGVKNAGYHEEYPTAVRPNFAKELFTGIDIMDCWDLVLQKRLKERDVDLLTRLAEKARLLVKRWFNETSPIYHDYTQFGCREALEGKQTNRTSEDLSHPIHGDSCDFKPDKGICSRETAAYPWRKYSAVMYFNDDFEGGKFFFANADESEQVSVVPKCGRMVAFPSDHLHGVKAITKGKRCAATVWFTATKSREQHKPTFTGIVQ